MPGSPASALIIDQVMPGSPAHRAHLIPGLRVVAVGDVPVKSQADCNAAVAALDPAKGVPLHIHRPRRPHRGHRRRRRPGAGRGAVSLRDDGLRVRVDANGELPGPRSTRSSSPRQCPAGLSGYYGPLECRSYTPAPSRSASPLTAEALDRVQFVSGQ